MFQSILDYVRARYHSARLADELYGLDDRDLADIGLSRSDIPRILAGAFETELAEVHARRHAEAASTFHRHRAA